jgi:hypothetical protein
VSDECVCAMCVWVCGAGTTDLPADVLKLQEIVRRQQAVIEELEAELLAQSSEDDLAMECVSTGLPTPRPVRSTPRRGRR